VLFDDTIGVLKHPRLPIAVERPGPHTLIRPSHHVERQHLPVRTPRFGLVLRALIRLREALGGAIAVGALSEDREVALAIRLKCDVRAVTTPNREQVPAAKR